MKNKLPIISIIVPIYNLEKYLDRCLTSIQEQTFEQYECLLIDDGSNDQSGLICEKYCKCDRRFLYCFKNNGGVSSARNEGLNKACGKYICFVDGDDCIEKDMLQKLYESICRLDGDIFQCGMNQSELKEKKEITVSGIIEEPKIFSSFIDSNGQLTPFVSDKIYQSTILKSVRFNEEYKYGEDFIFLADCLQNCKKIGYTEEVLYHYILNETSATQDKKKNSLKKVRDTIESIEYAEKYIKTAEEKVLLEKRVVLGLQNWYFWLWVNKREKGSRDIQDYLDNKLFQYAKGIIINSHITKIYRISFGNIRIIKKIMKMEKLFCLIISKLQVGKK